MQLMIYENAVPLSPTQHRNWSLEAGTDYEFCRNVNSVPLMVPEFGSAALEYAIVFGGIGDVVVPVAVLGVRTDQNLYVDREGGWQAKYIPAFVRRYPFVFYSPDQEKTFTLCIDEAFRGFNQSGRGERLFGYDGRPTPYVQKVLQFLQQYQLEFERTHVFCKKLKDLNLLEPMQAQIKLSSGMRMALSGFSVVSRARLKTVSASKITELLKSDDLELSYTHLASTRNFEKVRDWLSAEEVLHRHSTGGTPGAGSTKRDGPAQAPGNLTR